MDRGRDLRRAARSRDGRLDVLGHDGRRGRLVPHQDRHASGDPAALLEDLHQVGQDRVLRPDAGELVRGHEIPVGTSSPQGGGPVPARPRWRPTSRGRGEVPGDRSRGSALPRSSANSARQSRSGEGPGPVPAPPPARGAGGRSLAGSSRPPAGGPSWREAAWKLPGAIRRRSPPRSGPSARRAPGWRPRAPRPP